MSDPNDLDDPVFTAAADMLARTGARRIEFRVSEEEEPPVWLAMVEHYVKDGLPVSTLEGGARSHFEAAGAMDPKTALLRLLDQVIDGGTCKHCGRPTGITESWSGSMPMAELLCWYRYDPGLARFRRGCEGQTG